MYSNFDCSLSLSSSVSRWSEYWVYRRIMDNKSACQQSKYCQYISFIRSLCFRGHVKCKCNHRIAFKFHLLQSTPCVSVVFIYTQRIYFWMKIQLYAVWNGFGRRRINCLLNQYFPFRTVSGTKTVHIAHSALTWIDHILPLIQT